MKARIGGVTYDTLTSKQLMTVANGQSAWSQEWSVEVLYETSTKVKRYFLAGTGGQKSAWAKIDPNCWRTGKESILPLTKQQALDYLAGKVTSKDLIGKGGEK